MADEESHTLRDPTRDALREAEERVRLYAWHLEHLVPEESQRAIEPDPPA